ncbi:relaxase/mobilization nuclease domain-containing protein [Kitasatospora sp. NPDC101235]|uniref:relaxase/mobilization nuclease domain-containing protein n=1 Tax=Kitasatospora sp. NPDC101235 TaxID=3364101 RepID=UPI00380A56D3
MRVDQRGSRRRLKKPVWHCSVRTAPEDRLLSDEEWAVVARRVVAATGIAPDGDPDGCRWVAVRHADDHIHIAATIVRGNLLKADIENDYPRAQAECRKIEREWGLRELTSGDGTAAKEPTNREKHKAARLGEADTSRQQLRDAVRQALAGAASEAEFFARLETSGVLVNRKIGPSGDTLGYSVAVVGERDANGEPVWFGGYKLAPDLTLPKIRRRLVTPASERPETAGSAAEDGGARTPTGRRSPAAAARLRAADTALEAIDLLDGEPEAAAGVVEATGEVLDALAATALPAQKAELLAAARAYERASRSHVRAANSDSRAVRAVAREVLSGGYTTNQGPDATAAAGALAALILLVIAAGRWHAKQGHLQQAAAARAAADGLRAAYRQASAQPLAALRERGRQLPAAVRDRQEQAVRRAVPGEGGRRMLAEPEFDALAAALAEAEAAGHDPDVLLARARSWRELDTAGSVTAVLTWRVRHLAKLPHPAAGKPNRSTSTATSPTPATPAAPSRQRR